MIKMQVLGHLGGDAIIKSVNNQKVIEFSVAHTEKFTGPDGLKRETTTWVKCSFWRTESQSTEIAAYLTKGAKVYVEGKPSSEAWNDRLGGNLKHQLVLKVTQIELCGAAVDKSDSVKEEPRHQPMSEPIAPKLMVRGGVTADGVEEPDDLPF